MIDFNQFALSSEDLQLHQQRVARIEASIKPGMTPYKLWQYRRMESIGGSDIGTIMGVNKYSTPHQLWLEKTGRVEPWQGNDATHWGQMLEPVIASEYEKISGMKLLHCDGLQIPQIPYLIGSPDRIVVNPADETKAVAIWEGKTTRNNVATDEIDEDGRAVMLWGKGDVYDEAQNLVQADNRVPDSYLLQVHAYMLLTGIPTTKLSCLLSTSDFRTYTIDFNEDLALEILKQTREWWIRHILHDEEPQQTERDLKHTQQEPSKIVASDEIKLKIQQYKDLKKQADELDKQIQEVRDQIVGFVGTNEAIVDKDMKVLCSYKYQHGRTYINKDKLMLINPDAYQQCLAEYQGTRVLRLSRK
nr:MAG TPA: Exonuclease [Caudoviricetes sp.]